MHWRAKKRLAADRQVRDHLPGAVLQAKPGAGFLPERRHDAWGVAACAGVSRSGAVPTWAESYVIRRCGQVHG
jgi:hypothetical protein